MDNVRPLKRKTSKSKKMITTVVIIFFVLIGLIGALTDFITDWLWFDELGLVSVFFKKLFTQLEIGIPVFIGITLLTWFYLFEIKRGYFKHLAVQEMTMKKKTYNLITLGISALCGLILALMTAGGSWNKFLQFANATNFDLKDPIFDLDVGFYVFKLDFIQLINDTVIMAIIFFAIITFVMYAILLSIARPITMDTEQGGDYSDSSQTSYGYEDSAPYGSKENPFRSGGAAGQWTFMGKDASEFGDMLKKMFMGPNAPTSSNTSQKSKAGTVDITAKEMFRIASKQVVALGIVFFIMLAVHFFLKQYTLLYAHTGVLYGAGYTDINISLLITRAQIVLSLVGVVVFTIGIIKKNWKTIVAVPALMIIIAILGGLAGIFVQQLIVSPDERNKESKYLEYNIEYTQKAYDIDKVSTNTFPVTNDLTTQDIKDNQDSIRNIRINDYNPAKTFYNQTQSIRQYYTFNDVNVDRYMIDGKYTQTFLSAREIDETKINQQWLNAHLKYTHGYGYTLSRVDKVTASGQPDMLIKDIPPVSNIPEIPVERPEIYFGELTNNYIITGTNEKEFDYPEGESNVYSKYDGDAGIKLGLFNRALFAWKESSMKMLVSTNIDSNSKIIINRNITERVNKIMPYLDYSDPYMTTVDGQLYWIIDAYTKSNKYPYSEPYDLAEGYDDNYIRNSVKVVINAYNGDTVYYLVDESDPVANTMKEIYPKLFKSAESMPDGIRAHIRYPSKLLDIQANVYKRYHVNDVNVFYQGEDLWEISKEKLGAGEDDVEMKPNYYIMKLPGESDVEFVNSIPYTPRDKNNMIGLLVARNDGEHYGELVLYQFPKTKTIMGPNQVDAQIAQDTQISQDFSLWENSGSSYSRGNMFVIPIENSLMYVEPIYLTSTNSSLPEVKRVIIYYGDRIAYEPTLAEALDDMFGEGAGESATDASNLGDADGGSPNPDTEGDGGSSNGDATGTGDSDGDKSDSSDSDTDSDGSEPLTDAQRTQLIKDASKAYEDALAAQKDGDWAEYGAQMKKLETYLKKLDATS
ncbi:MAG: UPF0182 family protein [Clostridiales Family XIII bacterium]|jgi:uncharacterized membrane protein (UPF0182 family)|nr:UPF0182 family protein [Clostridiales Family XIII bacterium]